MSHSNDPVDSEVLGGTEPETLLFQTSPVGNIDAIVQHDGQCVYFFLNENPNSIVGKPKFGTRSCWVQNLTTGPLSFDQAGLQAGRPLPLPRTHTVSREGQPLPIPDSLFVVWFEEGNGAALVIRNQQGAIERVLAVIPPWSGQDGFHGYSAGCAVENEVCWPMPTSESLRLRIENASSLWHEFSSGQSPFKTIQPAQLEAYRKRFAPSDSVSIDEMQLGSEEYFSIDGGTFPQRGLLQIDTGEAVILLTTGMSLLPQPMVELASETPDKYRRIELGLHIPRSAVQSDEAVLDQARKNISRLAAYPWRSFTWLGPGHSCNFSNVRANCSNAILLPDSALRSSYENLLAAFRDDPVNLLWLSPGDSPSHQNEAPLTQSVMDDAVESGWLPKYPS